MPILYIIYVYFLHYAMSMISSLAKCNHLSCFDYKNKFILFKSFI